MAKIKSALNCDPKIFSRKYKAYKKAEAEWKEVYEPFKTALLGLYKNEKDIPSEITIEKVKLTYVSPSVRNTIDTKKLKEEEPELAKKFTKATSVDATMRIEEL